VRKGFVVLRDDVIRRRATNLVLILLLVALWSVTHHYQGLGGDARLYAVQAFARIHPNLLDDLYLRNTSQDSYTIFSNIYVKCIGLIGLRNAALTLAIVFKIWFFVAAWLLARRLSNSYLAFLASALLIITTGEYGAFGVFHYAEDWLTARSLAEALVVTALACYFRGSRFLSLLVACAAMFVHPLMALPGLLLLACLWLPIRLGVLGAVAGILLTLGISFGAMHQPSIAHVFVIMDASWLDVVRERSQFLFLQLWPAADWNLNARPFLSLSVSALVIGDARIRKLCVASMLVGATGLAVAYIAGLIGPVSLLLQGQAWRWVWLTGFTSVVLLAPTVIAMSRSDTIGLFCSLLMIFAWTFPTVGALACLVCTMILWLMRDRINAPGAKVLRYSTVLLTVGIFGWAMKGFVAVTWGRPPGSNGVPPPLVGRFAGIELLSISIFAALAWWIRAIRPAIGLPIAIALLVAVLMCCLPQALRDPSKDWVSAGNDDFSDWRRAIPPNANVFVVPARNSAAFSWFTLERPSYLTVDQSSGVVFSRATALEVRRRSQVLLPLMKPDWEILSNMAKHDRAAKSSISVLTREQLISLCHDPELDFVVATESVGFEPMRHTQPDQWKNWNLYDCSRVQSAIL
jgi:hypothetical protein